MNVKETAKALNVHYRTVYNMINDGRLKAEKVAGEGWEISEEQVNELLYRNMDYNRKAEDLVTAVYSLEGFKDTLIANTLRMLVEECNQVASKYEAGYRGRDMDLAICRLEERISRLKLARNGSEFLSLALQKANQYTDAAFAEIETEIKDLEGK